ncbi:MAG: ABC-2 family transporter protein [Lachnospiraceae bacterium]|nr:ABC-2 family transporter protein [Lachnospiraceae bacterium]
MLTAAKNQLRVCFLSIKYNIMREMVNKVTFLTNVAFMVLNDASILVQWFILFRLRDDVGGYSLREVLMLWGLVAASFGLSNLLFARVLSLPNLIINGKLDAFLVQPKNVLLGVLTSETRISAIGDFLYGVILVCVCRPGVGGFFLFLLFTITGAIAFTAFALLLGSLSFWFVRMDILQNQMLMGMINFGSYPDGIFQGAARVLLYVLIPVGMALWLPAHVMARFDGKMLLAVLGYVFLLSVAAVAVFYRGLRRYASGNLMEARL